jgi:cation-transporting ATPase 13A1
VSRREADEQFDMASITAKLSELDEDTEVPQIKLGDASCAAPFTSKLSNVSASECLIWLAAASNS